VPAYQVRGRDVRTVESIDADSLQPLLKGGATQCGACTPGVVMTAVWLKEHQDVADRFGIRAMMAGNLCRCTGYDGIVDSVQASIDSAGRAER